MVIWSTNNVTQLGYNEETIIELQPANGELVGWFVCLLGFFFFNIYDKEALQFRIA